MAQIILNSNLQGYFFENLNEINKKSVCPIPESIIFYSSNALGKFTLSQDFFDVSEGKVREKILGMKLLQAMELPREEQKLVYKEVADMSLVVCGYFAESVNRKLVDTTYYAQLGKMAYSHLNNLIPSFLDIPCFYGMVSTSFESATLLMNIMASKTRLSEGAHLMLGDFSKDSKAS